MPSRPRCLRRGPELTRSIAIDKAQLLLMALLLLGAVLYLQNAFRFFMYDDEGSYAYAAWRTSLGEVPYRDFLTPQLPVFLYWGGLVVSLCGRSFVALRLATMGTMLLAGGLFYAINRELCGRAVALVALALFLVDANTFHNARFFRPEAYMLLFALAGIYCFVLSEKRGRLLYAGLAGGCFGLAILAKLFGALPLGGCFAYLLYAWWRERRPWRQVLRQALALGLPALVLVGVVGLVFFYRAPYFLTAVFEHHTMQGVQLTMGQRVRKALRFYWEFVRGQPVAFALAAGGAWALLRRRQALPSLLVWQLPTALSFLVLSRSLAARHLTYLAPALATLGAVALLRLGRRHSPLVLVAAGLAVAAVYPSLCIDAVQSTWQERDTPRLAALVQSLTAPGEVVMADYPGANFAAGRPATYWAAGLSRGAAESGQIQGAMLIAEMERRHVSLVIINTAGGAHQMVAMRDYPDFRRYVQAHYALVSKFQWGYRQLEIYSRNDTMPLRSVVRFNADIALTGARLSAESLPAGSVLDVDMRWQAQQPMQSDYHVSLRLVDATGHVWAQKDESLREVFTHEEPGLGTDVQDELFTSAWAPQQVALQEHELPIQPMVPPGVYYLTATLYDLGTGRALPAQAGLRLPSGAPIIATVRLQPTVMPPKPEILPIAVALNKPLGQGLELLGAGPLPANAAAGQQLGLDLFWEAPERPLEDYSLQFALMQGRQVWQRWYATVAGTYTTSAWRKGEVLLSHYDLSLPANLPEGTYALRVRAVDASGRVVGRARVVRDLRIEPGAS